VASKQWILTRKPIIVILAEWFAPGYKAGGPIRSCVNFAMEMRSEYDIRVITTDRDYGAAEAYEGLAADTWTDYAEGIRVWYFSPGGMTFSALRTLIQELNPDFLYLNSMFSPAFTIWPLWYKLRGQLSAEVVLAPRGMLHEGALQYKRLKKQLFLGLIGLTGISRRIRFQATDSQEVLDIRNRLHPAAEVVEVANFPVNCAAPPAPLEKRPGSLRIVFISRISPKKNLDFLLALLPDVQARIQLDLYGPVEEASYWDKCQQQIAGLPDRMTVAYCGELEYPEVSPTLARYHLFCLPTHGENFGHAIFEALAAGRPVLISDQTPWRGLANQQAGWDISLSTPDAYLAAIELIAQMDQQEWDRWSENAWLFAKSYVQHAGLKEKYSSLFALKERA
jgi:glycosyltransferase involved in cell wall biosynthesis